MPQAFRVEVDAAGPSAGVGTLWLEAPGKPVVVLDLELIQRLETTLASLPAGLVGLVLASASERAFVAGADLKAIAELDDSELHRYLQYAAGVYGQLSQLPFPTAAAINGAALGGGLELAMHCDGLVGAPPPARDGQPGKPYPIGLPEAGLGICPGWGGTCLLPARIDPSSAIRQTAMGKPMLFDEAVKAGLFDMVAPDAGSVLAIAKQWVATRARQGRLARDGAPLRHAGRTAVASGVVRALDTVKSEIMATPSGAAVAACVDAGVTRGWRACLDVEQRELVRLRNTPAAKEAIATFFAKGKK